MIASSGGIVQSTSPGHQNSRSLRPAPFMAPATVRCALQPRHRQVVRSGGRPGGSFARDSRIYPRHRQDRARGCRAVPRVSGARSAVSGSLPRKTAAPRWPTGRARRRFLSLPPACRRAWGLGRPAGFRDTFGSVRESSAEDSCAAVAHGPGSLRILSLPPACHTAWGLGRPAGLRDTFGSVPGDFRGRLLRRGGPRAGLVAGFYPRHRHPRRLAWSARWVPGPGV